MNVSESTPPPLRIRDATLSGRIPGSLSDLVRFRHLIWYMALSSLAVESRGTKFGRTWWIIEPILLTGVYTVFVRVILHRGGPHFPLAILAAILSFEFFSRSVGRSMSFLRTAQSSMLSVAFPRAVVPLAVTLSETIRFVVSILAYMVIAAPFGVRPSAATALVVPFVVAEILFTLGLSYFLAAMSIFFRDMSKIIDYVFWLFFHLAPGMFTLAMVPATVRPYLAFNPFTTFFEGLRAPLLHGSAPHISMTQTGGVFLASIVLCVSGYLYFLQREGSFNKVVV